MGDRVRVLIADHIAEVALTRADKYNALDPAMFEEITHAGEMLKSNKDVRVVVFYGEGPNFCAGLDLSSFQGTLSDSQTFVERVLTLEDGEIANEFQKPGHVWRELEVPVITALQGVAFGGGCQIALGADMRIAAPDTRLSVMEIKWGLIPDMSITQTLPRLVRMDVAMDLVLTGRIVEAAEALELGLVTRIADDPLAVARDMARQIAERSPDAIRRDKILLTKAWNAGAAEGLRLEAELQAEVLGKPNQVEAVMANLQKRKPIFN